MIVEKVGKLPGRLANEAPTLAWWVGHRVQCPNCNTIVTLTAKDAPAQYDSFTIACPLPGCTGQLRVRPIYGRDGMIH